MTAESSVPVGTYFITSSKAQEPLIVLQTLISSLVPLHRIVPWFVIGTLGGRVDVSSSKDRILTTLVLVEACLLDTNLDISGKK